MKADDWSDEGLAERRDKLREPAVRAAFDRFVSYGISSPRFSVGPESHGYIKGFKFRGAVSNEWPFGFIANQADLLFYLRPGGVKRLRATRQGLSEWFDDVAENKAGELLLRIRNVRDAELAIEHVL
jgi:hypothetical protein